MEPWPSLPDEPDGARVLVELERCGSRDPDVLYFRRREMTARARSLRRSGAGLLAFGTVLTMTVVAAIAGIPALVDGWRRTRHAARQLRAIDAAFAAFADPATSRREPTRVARVPHA